MAAMKLAEYIDTNVKCFDVLNKAGIIPIAIIRRKQIYTYYSGLTAKSKMERYAATVVAMKSNLSDVRKAVKEMERNIKI